jgi:hypothetical protein
MKSDRERIQFVLEFLEKDFENLSPGEWLVLKEKLWAFLHWYPEISGEDQEQEFNVKTLQKVQGETKDKLDRLAPTDAQQASQTSRSILWSLDPKKIRNLFFTLSASEPGLLPLYIESDLRDTFFFELFTALGRVDARYLRRCPVCLKLFLAAHGNQEYCSPKCSNRERLRRYRLEQQKKHTKLNKQKPLAHQGRKEA